MEIADFVLSSEFDIKGPKSVAAIEVAVVLHVPRFDFFDPFHLTVFVQYRGSLARSE